MSASKLKRLKRWLSRVVVALLVLFGLYVLIDNLLLRDTVRLFGMSVDSLAGQDRVIREQDATPELQPSEPP
jgi:hypothetical protein